MKNPTRYVPSPEGRGRVETIAEGCACKTAPLIVNVREGRDTVRTYCARCDQDLSVTRKSKSLGVLIPFGARVEKDRPFAPRDPNETY